MTERLYYYDAYLRGFEATVVATEDGGLRVYLDRTAFYPTSGGQPFDLGTLAGVASRRYHGLLVAALPAPLGRQMMLNHLSELIRLPDGKTFLFGGEERTGALELHGADYLTEFRLERLLEKLERPPLARANAQRLEIEELKTRNQGHNHARDRGEDRE